MKSVLLNPFTSQSHHSWLRLHTLLCTEVPAIAPQRTKIAIFNFPLVILLPRIICFNFCLLPPHNILKIKSDSITSVASASLQSAVCNMYFCMCVSRQGCDQVTPESATLKRIRSRKKSKLSTNACSVNIICVQLHVIPLQC